MSEQVSFGDFDLVVETPSSREFVKPGYRKLTVESIEAQDLVEGKSPVVEVVFTKDGSKAFTEKFYFSGKPGKDGKPPIIYDRVKELYLGLTGNKFEEKVDSMTYSYGDTKYTVASHEQVAKILNKKLSGKSGIFKVGGTKNGEKTYCKLPLKGFLLTADFDGVVSNFTQERDFTDTEYNFFVKAEEKPQSGAAMFSPQTPPNHKDDLPF